MTKQEKKQSKIALRETAIATAVRLGGNVNSSGLVKNPGAKKLIKRANRIEKYLIKGKK